MRDRTIFDVDSIFSDGPSVLQPLPYADIIFVDAVSSETHPQRQELLILGTLWKSI